MLDGLTARLDRAQRAISRATLIPFLVRLGGAAPAGSVSTATV